MSALSKKLLSWLCVVAMVVAMVPAVALPASAEETEAAPEIQYGAANLPEGTQAIIDEAADIQDADLAAHIEAGTCPICGTVEGGWVEATYPNQTKVAGEKRHYYVLDTTAVEARYNWYAGNATDMTLCLALLNTTTPKEIGGLIGLRNSAVGCTLNIMGSGTITSDGSKITDGGQIGLVCVQGSSNTVNLYGGTFVYTGDGQGRNKIVTETTNDDGTVTTTTTYEPNGVISAAAINVKGHTNTVNIFDGVTIGPEEQDVTKPCFNLEVQLSVVKKTNTVNMYGGTIRNGVSNLVNTSGNVHLHYDKVFTSSGKNPTYPTFNMYGGTVSGGTYVESVSGNGGNFYAGPGAKLNIYGGTVTGGKVLGNGGNIYANSSSICKINISGGIIEKGEAKNGGNIYSSAPVNLSGTALIRDGVATTGAGGNISFASAKTHTISGGKVAGGTAAQSGGNIYMDANTVTISGGIIEGGTGAAGGNLSVPAAELVVTGGTIQDGTATGTAGGGNIYGSGDKTITITGGVIKNGKVNNADGAGGNLRVNCAAVNIGGEAQILGGEAGFMGGSIYVTSKCVMTIDGNAVISGGRSNHKGGNIALYNGDLIIGGNAQVKDGKATRYTVTRDEDGKITSQNHIADGGNIFCYGHSETVDDVKVYPNELTIKDNAVISGGWAVRGGNIAAENTTVNIESGVVVKDGCAGLEVDGEMTYVAERDDVGRGGNIFHGTKECEVNIAATLSGGQGRFGANLGVFKGTVNFNGIMEDGHAYSFGGNACVQGATLNMVGAELRQAISEGQGGNIRVYNGTVNMVGGKIYGGDDLSKNNTDNVWAVRATLNMSGDAQVVGSDAPGGGVRLVPYGDGPSKLILADTASVTGGGINSPVSVQRNADGDQATLYIVDGWNGAAKFTTTEAYTYGQTIENRYAVTGTFDEEGNFVKGGNYTGELSYKGIDTYSENGDVVIAAAGIVAADGTKSWFKTNDEALAAYVHGENTYAILAGETAQIPETVTELNVELVGSEVTFSGNAKLYGSDSENDDFKGNGKVIVAEGSEITVEPVVMRSANRYVAVPEENGWSFHRLAMWMDTVTLRTEGNPGIYYKATYRCDEALKEYVDSYGVAVSLLDMPGADFETADKYTKYSAESFAAAYEKQTVNTTSGAVVGIMKERNSKETNTANANMPIYANAYLKLNVGGEELVVMANTDAAYSLFEVLEGVNGNWDNYSDEEKGTIAAFIEKWAPQITEEAVAQLQTKLDKIFPAA